MSKPLPTKNPAKPKSEKKPVSLPAPKKQKPADDDLYDQGDMATPERDPPYEDGL